MCHPRPPLGFVALDRARRIWPRDRRVTVVIAGVDSYLTGPAVAHYLGNEPPALDPDNANGFIPGEAAAAVVCTPPVRGAGFASPGLGLAREEAHIYNGRDEGGLDLPLRGDGMAAPMSRLWTKRSVKLSDTTLKIGDQSGEKFFFQQTALAMLRVQRERSEVQPIWAMAASLGNVGAAVVPLMLGWIHTATLAAMRRQGRS
jgi:3-oxoacyl-[acyl-carrier-protein] synthase I